MTRHHPNRVARGVILASLVSTWWALGSGQAQDPPSPDGMSVTTTRPTTTASTTTTKAVCRVSAVTGQPILASDPEALSLGVARAAFSCSPALVVASPDRDLQAASLLAAAAGAPLLVTTDAVLVADEAGRLASETIYLLGDLAVPASVQKVVVQDDEARILAGQVVTTLSPGTVPTDTIWLADEADPALAAPVVAAAGARGERVVLVDRQDLRSRPEVVADIRRLHPTLIVAAGPFAAESLSWQVPALAAAPELPGGGLTLFPDRRLVAFYGNPATPNLGVLGQQGPEATIERLVPIAAAYGGDGVPTVPTFEIIVTVASARAGGDGDYSDEMSPDDLAPWIDLAGEQGLYVVLDLQPGRTDFLTQAMRYEEFLRLPHVGLALDPEWRIGPDQVHLRQVGTVDAAEVNTVVTWLAGIVRTEILPQKLLLLHQFKLSMITHRDLIETPPELAVVVQMDGQGPLGSKYGTYRTITAGAEDASFLWGWKNFYRLDSPLAAPEDVLSLDPLPVYVSFQ